MPKQITAKALLNKHVQRKDRVLLVNPPVEETRYSWIRWNQPLDLLKIGGYLQSEIGCTVEFLDLMKPDSDGKVIEEWLPGDRRYRTIGEERYPMRRFGRPYSAFTNWLVQRRAQNGWKEPSQVWITSLCSYWSDSVSQMCRVVRQSLPEVQLVLLGQYPRLLPEAAAEGSIADFVVSKPLNLDDQVSAFSLYGDEPPPFAALRLQPQTALKEIRQAIERGIYNFTFFEDDIARNNGEPLKEIVESARGLHRYLRFHAICGLYPISITKSTAKIFANAKLFSNLNFEEAEIGEGHDMESYVQALRYLREAGLKQTDARLSGFVWIGRPQENIENIVLRSFDVLGQLGGLIFKPFTPVPGGSEHQKHLEYLSDLPHQLWSPHFFPFAELNGISRGEYHDLYRLAAFLNEKIRSRSFDFLSGTLGTEFLRESLKREAWKLEANPLRVVNQPANI